MGDLDIKRVADGAEYMYYVGCSPSYDPRVQQVTRSIVRLFQQGGVDFGILGEEESCCGSEVRRLGEAGLFEMIVEENLELFKGYNVSKMFTTSPHCFNALRTITRQGTTCKCSTIHRCWPGWWSERELKFTGQVRKEGHLPRSVLPGQSTMACSMSPALR